MSATVGVRALEPALERVPCALCGATDFDYVYRGLSDQLGGIGTFDLVRCCHCGLTRTHPRPTPAAIGAYYPEQYLPYADRDDRALTKVGIFAAMRKLLSVPYRLRFKEPGQLSPPPRHGASMLDVGCGPGQLLRDMRDLGWDAWGIEPNPAAAERARMRAGSSDRVVTGSVEDADFAPGSYDLITLSHVLEHLHDPLSTLRQLNRWLRPGGTLRVWIPNLASAESRSFGRHWIALEVPRHLHHYTPATAARMLNTAGFDVCSMRPQFQGSSFAGSIHKLAATHMRRLESWSVISSQVYFAALPLGWLLTAFGNVAYLDILARRPSTSEWRQPIPVRPNAPNVG